jgi:hypothetical protein
VSFRADEIVEAILGLRPMRAAYDLNGDDEVDAADVLRLVDAIGL